MQNENSFSFLDEEISETETNLELAPIPGEGETDPRYKLLSHSSTLTLHSCPRKYQLSKLNANAVPNDVSTNITFAFGHAVGEAITDLFLGKSIQECIWNMFVNWEVGFLEENDKQKKSFSHAVLALYRLQDRIESGLLEGYTVATFEGKPAVELSFSVDLGGGFFYRGYVDCVLVNLESGEYVILENKTSSANYINHFQYKNSAQAIGYSVVLDKIVPGLSSYSVYYLVYFTKLGRWDDFDFPKTYEARALWIRDRLFDKSNIETLVSWEGNYGMWPTHGESCTNFGRECEYLNLCNLKTSSVMKPLYVNQLADSKEYRFNFKVEELLK